MLKYIKKYAELTPEEEINISGFFAKVNKTKIKQNIAYFAEVFENHYKTRKFYEKYNTNQVFSKKVALLLKEHPQLFLLETNPQNNASITSKTKFYNQYFKVSEYELINFYPELAIADVYPNSKAENMMQYLTQVLELDKKQVARVINNYPSIVNVEVDSAFENKVLYWQDMADYAEIPFTDFIARHPHLLGYSIDPTEPDSIVSKCNYYKKRFNITDEQLAIQIYQFPNFLGLDIDPEHPRSVENKTKKLNELGFSDKVIGNNLKALGAPLNKIKIRYIICKNFGMSDSVFLNNKFMHHESKLYARARFLKEHNFRPSLIYASEGTFMYETNTKLSELVKTYPLTAEVAKAEEEIFNKTNKIKINLSQEELNSINLKKYTDPELGE